MKKLLILLLILATTTACANEQAQTNNLINTNGKEEVTNNIVIKESNDKHIAYMKNYVGKNLATVGYTSWSGSRVDYLGETYIRLAIQTVDGVYVDIEDEDILKQYVVVAQNAKPNTEVRIEFEINSEGVEESTVRWQSIGEITLQVKKVGSNESFNYELVEPKQGEDVYTAYIPDFKGRNLLDVGYISWAGDLRAYLAGGTSNIKLIPVTDDGSFIDFENPEEVKKYVIYDQSLEPNTQIKFEYRKDSEGNEVQNMVERQTYKEMDVYVRKILE